jgi:hypothetical protein
VVQVNERGFGVVEPAQCFERHETRLREDDEPLDPARCFGEATLAAPPAYPVAHREVPAIAGDPNSVAAERHDSASDGHGARPCGSLLVHLELSPRLRRLRSVRAGRGTYKRFLALRVPLLF